MVSDTRGAQVARLIDNKAVCTAQNWTTDSAVCKVNGSVMTCTIEGCQPIKFTPPKGEAQ